MTTARKKPPRTDRAEMTISDCSFTSGAPAPPSADCVAALTAAAQACSANARAIEAIAKSLATPAQAPALSITNAPREQP